MPIPCRLCPCHAFTQRVFLCAIISHKFLHSMSLVPTVLICMYPSFPHSTYQSTSFCHRCTNAFALTENRVAFVAQRGHTLCLCSRSANTTKHTREVRFKRIGLLSPNTLFFYPSQTLLLSFSFSGIFAKVLQQLILEQLSNNYNNSTHWLLLEAIVLLRPSQKQRQSSSHGETVAFLVRGRVEVGTRRGKEDAGNQSCFERGWKAPPDSLMVKVDVNGCDS